MASSQCGRCGLWSFFPGVCSRCRLLELYDTRFIVGMDFGYQDSSVEFVVSYPPPKPIDCELNVETGVWEPRL